MTGDKKNWKGWGERILDGVLTYEQHLEKKKSSCNPTWYDDRLKKQEKLYEDYMKSLNEERHWRFNAYQKIHLVILSGMQNWKGILITYDSTRMQ